MQALGLDAPHAAFEHHGGAEAPQGVHVEIDRAGADGIAAQERDAGAAVAV